MNEIQIGALFDNANAGRLHDINAKALNNTGSI